MRVTAECLQRVNRSDGDGSGSGPVVSVYDLVIEARSRASFPALVPRVKPDLRTSDGRAATIVGVPTWFWVESASWHPITATATAGPVSVSVTATPSALSVYPGDGSAVACQGPGTALTDPAKGMAGSPDCGHGYTTVSTAEPAGQYMVTMAVTWTIAWTASTGAGGVTEPVTRQTTIPYVVRQARAHLVG